MWRTKSLHASGRSPRSSLGSAGGRSLRSHRVPWLLLSTSLIAACTNAAPLAVERVARRLGPEDFGRTNVAYHGEVAQIGDDARPVVVAPARLPVALGLGLSASGGEVRLDVDLPEATRALPTGSFIVTVQRFPLPYRLPDETFEEFSRTQFARQLMAGWRLERVAEDATRGVLVYTPPAEDLTATVGTPFFNLRLEALLPPPSTLESRPFEIPAAGQIELAYGLLNPAGASGVAPVRFAATLDCAGVRSELFLRTVDPATTAEAGWHDERHTLPPGPATCRLLLSATETAGTPPRGAVWMVPRILEVAAGDNRNLVLISLDTLRPDHLSGYGYARPTSPSIDAELIGRGTTFFDLSSTFPRTDVSHLSLFTGLYGEAQPAHGRLAAADAVPLLTERLRDAGLETAAFTENALIAGSFGFWFGFDRFVERSFREQDRGLATFEDGIQYLRDHRDRRFFLFLHTYKTHDPYVASEPYAALFREENAWLDGGPAPDVPPRHRELVDAYDRTIREADDLVSALLAELAALKLEDRTIVVLLSDHGESFGEHGATGHGFSGFREQLWVPLVLRGPGIPANRRIDTPASLVDVAPTLLELFDLAALPDAQGISLAPALRGEPLPPDRPLFFSWLQTGAIGVRRDRWKYLRSDLDPEGRVYDVRRDPAERQVLPAASGFGLEVEDWIAAHRTASAALRQRLRAEESAPAQPALSDEMERSLRALGYIE